MKEVDITILKNEYNAILTGYLESREHTLEGYIYNLPEKTRVRFYKIEELLNVSKRGKIQ